MIGGVQHLFMLHIFSAYFHWRNVGSSPRPIFCSCVHTYIYLSFVSALYSLEINPRLEAGFAAAFALPVGCLSCCGFPSRAKAFEFGVLSFVLLPEETGC